MADWKFRNKENLESFLVNELGVSLMLPKVEDYIVRYFSNGDRMTINLETGQMEWEPINPGEMATSRLSMKLHIWFSRGIIVSNNSTYGRVKV